MLIYVFLPSAYVFPILSILYTQLPFADNSLAGDIAVRVQRSGSSEAVMEPLFSRGIRLWKSDLGPIRPGALTAVSTIHPLQLMTFLTYLLLHILFSVSISLHLTRVYINGRNKLSVK